MHTYDSENFDPPAPVAKVTLRDPATGVLISNIPLLMDTGADVTLLPISVLAELGIAPEPDTMYEIQGFDGETSFAQSVSLELIFLDKKFTGRFLLIDQPMGILGRNVLNSLSLLYDGRKGEWVEILD